MAPDHDSPRPPPPPPLTTHAQTPSVAVVEMLQCLTQAMPLGARKPGGKQSDAGSLFMQVWGGCSCVGVQARGSGRGAGHVYASVRACSLRLTTWLRPGSPISPLLHPPALALTSPFAAWPAAAPLRPGCGEEAQAQQGDQLQR